MKKLLLILFLFPFLLHAQEDVDRFQLRHQLQRCLDGSGNPIPGCMVVTDHLGKQVYFMPADTLYVDGTDLCYITVRGDTVCVEISGAGNTDTRLIPYENGDSLCFYLYNAVTDDTLSHVCFFIEGGGGTDTHFFGDDLTSDGDHTHDQDGNDIVINNADTFKIRTTEDDETFISINGTTNELELRAQDEPGDFSHLYLRGNTLSLDVIKDFAVPYGGLTFQPGKFYMIAVTADGSAIIQMENGNMLIQAPDSVDLRAGDFIRLESATQNYKILPIPPAGSDSLVLTIDHVTGNIHTVPRDSLGDGGSGCDSLEFFTNDDEAIGVGVNPGQYYLLDDDNTYGMAWGVVKVVSEPGDLSLVAPPGCIENSPDEPFSFYEDDDEADTIGGLDVGEFYLLSDDNLYGMPTGTMKQRTL